MKMNHQKANGIAHITGAPKGIGAVHADRLSKRGYELIPVARDEERLKMQELHPDRANPGLAPWLSARALKP
jgi:short-subunit dehydrogenase